MKLKVGSATASLVFAAASSLTSQGVNAEVVRLNKIAGERLNAHDWASAERHYLHALDIAAGSEAKHTIATLHHNLGTLYTAENRYTDAEKQHRLSYDLLKAEYGEQDPKVALALNAIGEVTCLEGYFTIATSLFQRSLGILQLQKSSGDTEIATVLTNLAATEWSLGNLSRAEKTLRQATTLFESAGNGQQLQLAFALQIRARLAEQEGDLRSARPITRRLC
jgi:tetratricopeptide (TPR) repeat protein